MLLQSAFSAVPVLAVINAFRGQVFAAAVQFTELEVRVLMPSCVLDSASLAIQSAQCINAQCLNRRRETHACTGVRTWTEKLPIAECRARRNVRYEILPSEVWNPTAAEVARLGRIGFEAGLARNAFTLEPNYIRASAAEEKAKEIKV